MGKTFLVSSIVEDPEPARIWKGKVFEQKNGSLIVNMLDDRLNLLALGGNDFPGYRGEELGSSGSLWT